MTELNQIFDIIGGTEKSEYSEFTPQSITNMFFTQNAEAIQRKALFPREGLSIDKGLKFNIGGSNKGGRASYYLDDKMFQVVKDTIFMVTADYNEEGLPLFNHFVLGTLNTETGPVGIADNNQQIIFVDGVNGYLYDLTTGNFGVITSPGFPTSPSTVAVLGNRFIVNKGETKESYYSAQGNGLSWGANDFFSMDLISDIVVAYATLNGRLYVMGQRSTEVWYVVRSPTLPFRPQKPAIEYGCNALGAVAVGFDMIVWLSRTNYGIGGIRKISGQDLSAQISNESIDTIIDKSVDLSDSTAFLYKNDVGHIMYVINFNADDLSYMYDFNMNKWSKLESNEGRFLANAYIDYKNHHYVLDYENPYMYEMSTDFNDDAGLAIKREVVSPVFLSPNPMSVNEYRLFLKQGTGLESGIDQNPLISLEVSWDGGISYGESRSASLGEAGKRFTKTFWNTLGVSDSWVFRHRHYNKTKCIILGAMGNVSGGKK